MTKVPTLRVWRILGPVVLSALSLLIAFKILQPFASFLSCNFNLLSNRGIGKAAFIIMVILQIILLLICSNKKLFNKFFNLSFCFFYKEKWVKSFLKYFAVFFALHAAMQLLFFLLGYSQLNPISINFNISFVLKMLLGLFAAFMVAWTEESIFRAMIYNYFRQFTNTIPSIFITSIIFMFAHDLSNPLNLVTKNWQLGLGLFLLGILLNLIYVLSGKLYTAMGAHMGLVAVKVVLRRIKIFSIIPEVNWPFWVNSDLRKSFLIHVLFAIAIIVLIYMNYKKLKKTSHI